MQTNDTIAAQATPLGRGGIGIIRISGSLVPNIIKKILGKILPARQADFCNFFTQDKKIIDQGLAIYFPAPHSFTGEEVLELHGHGGQVVMDLLLQRVLELGARLAKPGEFTERAFLNRKIDLVQAEAVADLINAATSEAAKNAIHSLQGKFSHEVHRLVALLKGLRARVEAAIDFTEEPEIEQIMQPGFDIEINNLLLQIEQLKNTAKQGIILREGIRVVITGAPNAGKSSLMNYLSGQDTAIVTDIPGTTRDVLRVWLQLDGLPIHLLDTAGLHDQPGLIEEEGIRRAWEEIKQADHVLLMIDANVNKDREPKKIIMKFLNGVPKNVRLTILYNKIDLTGEEARMEKINNVDCIYLAVKTKQGLDLLKQHLKADAGFINVGNGFSARSRHLDALKRAKKFLQNIKEDLLHTNKIELIAEELKQAQNALGEITGEVTVENLLDQIFSEFCLGK